MDSTTDEWQLPNHPRLEKWMHPNQEPNPRKLKLTSPRSASIAVDLTDSIDDEDALWDALPDTVPLDPKIIAIAEMLCDEENSTHPTPG